ncbi:MAG: hypothetical protein K9K66_02845 [Desulfarculaceae bacterium]|nr:hypothetical protein [Desulfarculaceae bacterium]MCF8070986.1 hypothetical protein [Desulfarculaceae bacterium]MCF8100574.1 hypothetical protein [Desulfarculaceae bacterium]MCF8117706.1 hypothetical protein [Desulfarculaceae bacterium]
MLKFITRNWQLKLISLAIAVFLWALVVGQENAEVTVRMPVVVTGLSADLVVANQVDNEVELRLYGPQSLVRQVATRPQAKQLNLTGMGTGEHIFQVLPEDLSLPPGVEVVRISPARLRLQLAHRYSRKAAVRPVIKGNPAPGFEVNEVEFKPAEVTVSGLKAELTDLDWIWTVPLEVTGLKETTTLKANLRAPDGRAIRLVPNTVQAVIHIRPRPERPAGESPPAKKDQ